MSDIHEPAPSPWHDGEIALQKKLGVAERMEQIGHHAIRPFMPDQHREFFAQLPFIVAGSVDSDGDAWATLIPGRAGFISSPSNKRLDFAAKLDPSDPVTSQLRDGASVALLGIELHTRRRNRMNGLISMHKDGTFGVDVVHSFGNCPQYIQMRQYEFVREPDVFSEKPVRETSALDPDMRKRIEAADTFFVASYVNLEEGRQVDISHRGGKPGFVRVSNDGTLTIPDYAGNLFFNTLGNLVKNPRAGLVFPDFETGDIIHLTGDAEVILESPAIAAFEGAERLWTFKPRRIVWRQDALPLRWSFKEYSPNVMMTGTWEEAAQRLEAETLKTQWRPFRVQRVVDESTVIKSFWLEPADGKGLARHEAGQHLPIRIEIAGESKPLLRTYTLSVAPSDSAYRISVKKDGKVSNFLHNKIKPGDMIMARAPQGAFTIESDKMRPAVMLAAGVGITPFAAMLRHLLFEGHRTRGIRPAWLFQAAKSYEERAFDKEFEEILEQGQGNFRLVRLLSQTDEPRNAQKGVQGRLSIDVLKAVLPFDDYDFYLCGPPTFMEDLYNGLRDMNVPDKRIFFESFGPASVQRRPDAGGGKPVRPGPSTEPVKVVLAASGKEASWTPEAGSLLELAEARGVSPPFSCRMGSCGSCKTKLLKGTVTYEDEPSFPVEDDEALLCCAVPAIQEADEDAIVLDV